jgi:alpha,alpha-trehalose phosphorylase (configuration-retaining)
VVHDLGNADVAIAIHDAVYLQDFCVKSVNLNNRKHSRDDHIADYVVKELKTYERSYLAKFIGAGLPHGLKERSPNLSSRLWLELDIVPISIMADIVDEARPWNPCYWHDKSVDEQADAMVRRCIMYAYQPLNTDTILLLLTWEVGRYC